MENINVPPVLTTNAPHIIQSLALPHFGETVPGPLHTIVTAPDGRIYYSDELNHTVVSLNGDGSIRWRKTKQGTTPGEFWYPKGLSLGYLQLDGSMIHCLAVADSWNRRIQFLDVEGRFLTAWTQAGDRLFGEVVDTRYIAEKSNPCDDDPRAGCWFVLDRGNHRLCRMAISGDFVDQIGRCLPQSLHCRWAIPEIFFADDTQDIEALGRASPLDFTFYPDRIFGNALDTLFIAESGCQNLKQVTPPHLFPLHLSIGGAFQWIAADASGILAYDKAGNRLLRQGIESSIFNQAAILGRPVFSDLSTDKVWLQTNDRMEKWEWDLPDNWSKSNHVQHYPLVAQSASEETKRLNLEGVRKSVEVCLAHLDQEIRLADTILAMGGKYVSPQFLEGMSGHVPEFPIKCSRDLQKVQETLHYWCLGRLEHHLAGSQGQKASKLPGDVKQMQATLAKEIKIRIADIQKRVHDLSSRMQSQVAGGGNDKSNPNSWLEIALMSKSNLEFAEKWVSNLSGISIS